VEETAGCSFRLSPSHFTNPLPSGAEKCAWDMLQASVGSRKQRVMVCPSNGSLPPPLRWKYSNFDVQSAMLVGSFITCSFIKVFNACTAGEE